MDNINSEYINNSNIGANEYVSRVVHIDLV